MEIYLTFDDGIQAGTEEVLDVLRAAGVKATFFLVGIETRNAYKKNPDLCKKLLKDIFENHSIGNHSYTHAHYLFNSYYEENGIPVDDSGNRRLIVDDFRECVRRIGEVKSIIMPEETPVKDFLLSKFQKIPLARLPGRNTWYLSGADFQGQKARTIILYKEGNTVHIAKELNAKGYEVFGWNEEWRMNFDYQKEAIEIINSRKMNAEYHFSEEESVHPDFDMYAPSEEAKDRLSESWQSCFTRITTLRNTKVILLMHDRAFRKGNYTVVNQDHSLKSVTASDELLSLITQLRQMNVIFKKLDEY